MSLLYSKTNFQLVSDVLAIELRKQKENLNEGDECYLKNSVLISYFRTNKKLLKHTIHGTRAFRFNTSHYGRVRMQLFLV